VRFADLDAVTIDYFGTLADLEDQVPLLAESLRARGVDTEPDLIAKAVAVETDYYAAHYSRGRDAAAVEELNLECTAVFLETLGAPLQPDTFVHAYLAAIRPRVLPGVASTLARLRSLGLALAVVSNADFALSERLAALGILPFFDAVVTSAEVGAAKPDRLIFDAALRRLAVHRSRALHVGDSAIDREGAEAAGMAFRPAPLAEAFGQR
jgi:putative hydrolase of the HAD superfamily